MLKPAGNLLPLSFQWRLQAPGGVLTGQQKAAMAERMEEISERVSSGRARVEFSFDRGAVIARISAKIDPGMRQRSEVRAQDHVRRGLSGALARFLLWRHGLGVQARDELERRFQDRYLLEEQGEATAALMHDFSAVMALSAAKKKIF